MNTSLVSNVSCHFIFAIGSAVLEKIFEGFLTYLGMVAIY